MQSSITSSGVVAAQAAGEAVTSETATKCERISLSTTRAGRLWPDIAFEVVRRIADALSGREGQVLTTVPVDGTVLIIGMTLDELREGLAAERIAWRDAADHALAGFDARDTDDVNAQAIETYAAAELRVDQADLLLTAVQTVARDKRRDGAHPVTPGCALLPPDTPGLRHDLGASRHDCAPHRASEVSSNSYASTARSAGDA